MRMRFGRLAWWVHRAARPFVERQWVSAVSFSIGLTALGAALGVVPDIAVDGWRAAPARQLWFALFSGCAGVFLGAGGLLWRRRSRLLRRRGTAYIVHQRAADWTIEETEAFVRAVRAQFAATMLVPGPDDLDGDWDWPLDRRTDEWDVQTDLLVRYFWAAHFNDEAATPNAVFLWASWPVALAFGTRAVTGRRGLALEVRQRPSYGRAGTLKHVDFRRPGHTFLDPAPAPPRGTITEHDHDIVLNPHPGGALPAHPRPVTILLLRTSGAEYGPLLAAAPGAPVDLHIVDRAGLELPTNAPAQVREWRYTAPGGRLIDWDDYPGLVDAAVGWICRAAATAPGIVLLGAAIPQELATGIGINATTRTDWPTLWPILHGRRGFTVPALRLDIPSATAH
jgi:hypothetical protein